ncbi:hypothetical protein SDRG_10816 [Saprolegnia diclina VS20]|uniref:Uncharacterized protein n=1 Tax=Saprolegnia diclina (strain VS20) TaxID=1156394 RepID=T0QAF1_SAPDV|nr:hypothetical protein SDRG_10816 [Saprolegnia diclina VS20]EQC31651.1 hypothetical protein SDRG_10816 [Saprolegnia diclina VS20]|eukprot:XP_008615050.1 hypothetical protein SDRG_10816 [Saprolegnia diclina VS20]
MSLFELADAVFEAKPSSAPPRYATASGELPTLFLLDETLQQLHLARPLAGRTAPVTTPTPWTYKPRDVPTPLAIGALPSASPNAPSSSLSASQNPLRRVFSNSLLEASAPSPRPPLVAQTPPCGANTETDTNDAAARSALKAALDECDAYDRDGATSAAVAPAAFAATIEDKYLRATLAPLPTTPFVALARKRLQRRLLEYVADVASANAPSSAGDLEAFGRDIRAVLTSLQDQTSNQRTHDESDSLSAHVQGTKQPTTGQAALLAKLATLPKAQLEKLPKAQQELVAFSKRYQQVLSMAPADVAQLPPHTQQFVVRAQAMTK